MKFRTEVSLPSQFFSLTPQSRVVLLGSCFADHMGEYLCRCLPSGQVYVNPHGTLYNPVSIAYAWRELENECFKLYNREMFCTAEGAFRHWQYATRYTAESEAELRDLLTENWQKAKAVYDRADVLFITLSTDHVYYLREGDEAHAAVANCHKQPAKRFEEKAMSKDVAEEYLSLFERFFSSHPKAHIVFTLSPYRYAKYGMHENALSKARLLLFIDRLCAASERVHYFPAYEIVMDELRDYRFFAEDMLHPSDQAVAYVWERFSHWAFDEKMREYVSERERIVRDENHRPLQRDSQAFAKFREQLEKRKQAFLEKWNATL